jgi:hypothetical protein
MVDPPPDLQEEVQLHQRNSSSGANIATSSTSSSAICRAWPCSQLLRSLQHIGRGRLHAAPQAEGFGSLLDQHAQAVAQLCAMLGGELQEYGGWAPYIMSSAKAPARIPMAARAAAALRLAEVPLMMMS